MSEKVAGAPKAKKIAKASAGRQVRLWVRAKFLSFRRQLQTYTDRGRTKTRARPFSDSRELTIAVQLSTISVSEWPTSTRRIPERPKTDLEYAFGDLDHLGPHYHQPRKHWSRFGQIRNQLARQSHWLHPQSHAVPSERLIRCLFKSRLSLFSPTRNSQLTKSIS